jgi:hypothetical protein
MRTKLLGVLKGKLRIIKVVMAIEASPEKAGVGGSTPSLATMFSITYRSPFTCTRTDKCYGNTEFQ